MKIILQIKNFTKKGLALNRRRKSSGSGFVILFAVTISSIVLAVTMGVTEISTKELIFGTSAKETGEAFLASDTAVECALFYDKSTGSAFPPTGNASQITCASNTLTPTSSTPSSNTRLHSFVLTGLGGSGMGCAKVDVLKDSTNPPAINTTVAVRGYNTGDSSCNSTNLNRVERSLGARY